MKSKYHTIDITLPIQGRVVITNQYWFCKDGDPKQAMFYGNSPQCNRNKGILERLLQYTIDNSGWNVEIVFFEIAYRPQSKQY